PRSNVFLWGGFTDGDRACYMVAHYEPKRIILAGMDFGENIGRWSKPGHSTTFLADGRKLLKLKIAEYLLSVLWMGTGIDYTYLKK
ncbi:MAG: 6-hydroxymethyl-7,8-dihydropterin pyrophosphokinase, partial [Candidatus Thorarchaeota archaeon]